MPTQATLQDQWQSKIVGFRMSPLVITTLVAAFSVPLGLTGTAVALPAIARDLGSDPGALQWVVNSYNVSFAVFTVITGFFMSHLGDRRVLLAGISVLFLASLISICAPTLMILDLARALAGVGAAAILTAVATILNSTFTGPARSKAFGLLGTTMGSGLAFGPTLSGLMITLIGWRGAFSLAGLMTFIALLLGFRLLRKPTTGLIPLKLLDFSPLTDRRFLAACSLSVVQALGFISLLTYLPVALGSVRNFNEATTGLLMLVMTGPVLLLPLLVDVIIGSRGNRAVFWVIGTSLFALVCGNGLLLTLSPEQPMALLLLAMLFLGLAFGLPMGLLDGEALRSIPSHSVGSAAGLFNAVRIGSEAASVALYSTLLLAFTIHNSGNPELAAVIVSGDSGYAQAYSESFHHLQVLIFLVVALGAVGTFALFNSRQPKRSA